MLGLIFDLLSLLDNLAETRPTAKVEWQRSFWIAETSGENFPSITRPFCPVPLGEPLVPTPHLPCRPWRRPILDGLSPAVG